MKTAKYCLLIKGAFWCRIPKKRGKGYLVAAFGGHHLNKPSREWERIRPKVCGDLCDIDGFLSIGITKFWWEHGFKEDIEEIKKSLQKVFPHITEWKEIKSIKRFCQ